MKRILLLAAFGYGLLYSAWADSQPISGLAGRLASTAGSGLAGYKSAAANAMAATVAKKFRSSVECHVDFGADNTGVTDATTALNNCFAAGGNVRVMAGTYKVSSYLLVPANTFVTGDGPASTVIQLTANVPLYTPWGAADQHQIVLINGNNAGVFNLQINAGAFIGCGIGVSNVANDFIGGNYIWNCGRGAQGILQTTSTHQYVYNNYIFNTLDGMEIWQVTHGQYSNNFIDTAADGGWFEADSEDLTANGNTISNCGDVGLDAEGGVNIALTGNTVRSANNGELSYFANGTGSGRIPRNVVFSGNVVYRTTTYLAGAAQTATATSTIAGGIMLASSTNGEKGIVFTGNAIYATGRTALWANDQGVGVQTGFDIENNNLTSDRSLFTFYRALGAVIKANYFHGLSGAEINEGEWKNPDGGVFEHNTITYDVTKKANYALHYYTDVAITIKPVVAYNTFHNCGAYAFEHDPYISNVPAIVYGNAFSDTWQANGGVYATTNGYPLYRGQRLLVSFSGPSTASLDILTLAALGGPFTLANMLLRVWSGGVQGSTYSLIRPAASAITSRDGTGSGSGIGTSTTRYAVFSGTTIRLTGVSSQTVTGYLTLDLTSSQ